MLNLSGLACHIGVNSLDGSAHIHFGVMFLQLRSPPYHCSEKENISQDPACTMSLTYTAPSVRSSISTLGTP